LHDRLHPYIYSYAVQAAETGFPYTFTPLPLAYPQDPGVYGLADTKRRSYQWLLGESLLATPLYGDDYATAQTRDVYLPEGRWIEYDSGTVHEGPTTLKKYPLPVGRTPLFVGGPGIVVEQEWGRLLARIYPVRAEASMTFTDRSGEKSVINVDVPSWENDLAQVTETGSGSVVRADRRRGALEFVLEPGRDYTIRSIPLPPPVVLQADDDGGVVRPD
jgi:alpha-glucosidase (family GH31 glycosyl hydrolase)